MPTTVKDFPEEYFRRYDESSDTYFYQMPRKVVHIDAGAIDALTRYYAEVLPENAIILDLMSSWRSHLPEKLKPQRVIGLGMNAVEMADNPQLDEYVVQNLNEKPRLLYKDNTFDAVTCAVSIQYLTQPIAVFSEIRRVLKPGGICVVSFSNRCFPTKAVAVWLEMSDRQHLALVKQYYEKAGNFTDIQTRTNVEPGQDPLYIVSARKAQATG